MSLDGAGPGTTSETKIKTGKVWVSQKKMDRNVASDQSARVQLGVLMGREPKEPVECTCIPA